MAEEGMAVVRNLVARANHAVVAFLGQRPSSCARPTVPPRMPATTLGRRSALLRHLITLAAVALGACCGAGPALAQAPALGSATEGFVAGDFPPLPPDPYDDEQPELQPLEEELWEHGGSYLYQPEGDRLGWPSEQEAHYDLLRLPASWQEPRPLTAFADFLGADPVVPGRRRHSCYWLDPRWVVYGSYELFGRAFEQSDQRHDLIGHDLRIDLDMRLTGTERFHVQFRPLGARNTGGSFYQLNDPESYLNNSTGEPDRYWFEGELHSFSGFARDPAAQHHINFMLGKFPFILHNSLLMNDEILGGVISQNNVQFGWLSNLNMQLFVGGNDVDTYVGIESQLYGVHVSADHRGDFYEATYAYVDAEQGRSTRYIGLSRTHFLGPMSIAMRGLVKLGDEQGLGNSHLLTLESNCHRVFTSDPFGFHHGVFFCNAFWAAEGWNSIGGTNFNRLRTAFEVDPLIRLATVAAQRETVGTTLGVQLFRNHEDESLVPEFAWETRGGDAVFGFGLRYLRKTGPRTFLELLGVTNWSDVSQFDRDGIAVSHTYLY